MYSIKENKFSVYKYMVLMNGTYVRQFRTKQEAETYIIGMPHTALTPIIPAQHMATDHINPNQLTKDRDDKAGRILRY
ncbi:hypothetical protein GCM10028805_03040 [Spirosoma harenae]